MMEATRHAGRQAEAWSDHYKIVWIVNCFGPEPACIVPTGSGIDPFNEQG